MSVDDVLAKDFHTLDRLVFGKRLFPVVDAAIHGLVASRPQNQVGRIVIDLQRRALHVVNHLHEYFRRLRAGLHRQASADLFAMTTYLAKGINETRPLRIVPRMRNNAAMALPNAALKVSREFQQLLPFLNMLLKILGLTEVDLAAPGANR